MEYSEDIVNELLQKWKDQGYTDTIIVENGRLLARNRAYIFLYGS
jgi:hypothetical protein